MNFRMLLISHRLERKRSMEEFFIPEKPWFIRKISYSVDGQKWIQVLPLPALRSHRLSKTPVASTKKNFQVVCEGRPIHCPNNTGYCCYPFCLLESESKSLLLKTLCMSDTRPRGSQMDLTWDLLPDTRSQCCSSFQGGKQSIVLPS